MRESLNKAFKKSISIIKQIKTHFLVFMNSKDYEIIGKDNTRVSMDIKIQNKLIQCSERKTFFIIKDMNNSNEIIQ